MTENTTTQSEPTEATQANAREIARETMLGDLKELESRIAALEAEKAERERQEPVAWACGHYLFKHKPHWATDSISVGEEPNPLYAHPLAMREPTSDECREIWREMKAHDCDGSKICEGRAMWQAVREVMTK